MYFSRILPIALIIALFWRLRSEFMYNFLTINKVVIEGKLLNVNGLVVAE